MFHRLLGAAPPGRPTPHRLFKKIDRRLLGLSMNQTRPRTERNRSRAKTYGQDNQEQIKGGHLRWLHLLKKRQTKTKIHLDQRSRQIIAGNQAQKPSDDLLASRPGWWKFYEMNWYDLPGEDPQKMTREALERARRKPVKFAAERSGGWVS